MNEKPFKGRRNELDHNPAQPKAAHIGVIHSEHSDATGFKGYSGYLQTTN